VPNSNGNISEESDWIVVSLSESAAPNFLTEEVLEALSVRLAEAAENVRQRIASQDHSTEDWSVVAMTTEVGDTTFQFRVAIDGDRDWGPGSEDDV
jgi:DNA polymerase III delta prime subunit